MVDVAHGFGRRRDHGTPLQVDGSGLWQSAFLEYDGADVGLLLLAQVSAFGLRLDVSCRSLVAGASRIAALVVVCATRLLDFGA